MAGTLLLDIQVGGYVSVWKVIPVWLVLMAWAWLLTWADKDADAAHLPRVGLNLANVAGMVVGFALFLYIPYFILAFPILLLVLAAEVAVYLYLRHQKVGLADVKGDLQNLQNRVNFKKKKAAPAGPVNIAAKAGGVLPPPEMESPERLVYDAVQGALTDPLRRNCEQLDLTPSADGLTVKYIVDGVGYDLSPIDPATGAGAIGYLKGAAGLDANEKRKPQTGTLKLGIDEQKLEARIQTAGTTAGEYLRLMVNPNKRTAFTLDQLGLSEKSSAAIKGSLNEGGVVLLAAPKGQGLTSLMYAILRSHDAFITHIHTIEREAAQDLEGITQNKLAPGATPAEELKQVRWVMDQEPEAILIDKVENPETAAALIKFAASGKKVYVGFRGGSTADAIDQWRKVAGSGAEALQHVTLAVAGRILRKLCAACKVAYTPEPARLKQLNMSPDKVQTLFQARDTPLRDPKGNPIPCTFCRDLHFKGRVGVYEVLAVDDEIREAILKDIATGGRVGNAFKAAFRKNRGRHLSEEAMGLVEKGDTSVQEVLRVLRGGEETAARAARASTSATAAAPVAAAAPRAAVRRPTA